MFLFLSTCKFPTVELLAVLVPSAIEHEQTHFYLHNTLKKTVTGELDRYISPLLDALEGWTAE